MPPPHRGPNTAFFMVDVSALTKGLGNIRKWLESPATDVVLWIPSYTLHEIDYLKKGLSMIAINAREGIKLIDKTISSADPAVSSKVSIETPEEVGPKWKDCIRYKARAPRVGEFPRNQKSAFTAVPVTMSESEAAEQLNSAFEGGAAGALAADGSDERAELPGRLRFLLRPLIQKTHIDPENWIFVTEDNSTRIWCESFRIKCINVSEADALLFHTQVLNNGSSTELESEFTGMTINEERPSPSLSAQASERKKKGGRRSKKRSSQSPGIGANVATTPLNANARGHQDIKIESFNTVEFTPRGKGDLWVP